MESKKTHTLKYCLTYLFLGIGCMAVISFQHMRGERPYRCQGRLPWEAVGGSCPLWPHSWGAGRARIALHTKLFPSLQSAEEAFFGIVESLVQENFSGGKPQTTKLSLYYLEINVLSIVLLEKSLKTRICICSSLWRSIYKFPG